MTIRNPRHTRDSEVDDLDLFISEQTAESKGFADALHDAEHRLGLMRCLITLRKSHNMSQAEVAKAMSTTQSTVSEFEGGGKDFFLSTLQRYARALNAKIEIYASSDQVVILPEDMKSYFRQPNIPALRLSLVDTAASRFCTHVSHHASGVTIDHGPQPGTDLDAPQFDAHAIRRIAGIATLRGIELVSSFYEKGEREPLPLGSEIVSPPKHSIACTWQMNSESRDLGTLLRYEAFFGKIEEEDKADQTFVTAEYRAVYLLGGDEIADHADLAVYSYWNGVYQTWPYWREFFASMTNRGGLGRHILPLFVTPQS